MLTHRPPNLVAAFGYLTGGLLIAACFLSTCFPSSAADIRNSISGNEWGVLVAFVLVGLLAVSALSNVFRVAIQLVSQAVQLAVLAVAVWGGILLYQNHNRSDAKLPATEVAAESVGNAIVDPPKQQVPVQTRESSGKSKWWQDNPYEKD